MSEYADAFNEAVAAELRAQRGRQQITINEIVTTTGLSKSAVLNYMNGKRDIPVPALMDICRALGISAGVIFDRAEQAIQ